MWELYFSWSLSNSPREIPVNSFLYFVWETDWILEQNGMCLHSPFLPPAPTSSGSLSPPLLLPFSSSSLPPCLSPSSSFLHSLSSLPFFRHLTPPFPVWSPYNLKPSWSAVTTPGWDVAGHQDQPSVQMTSFGSPPPGLMTGTHAGETQKHFLCVSAGSLGALRTSFQKCPVTWKQDSISKVKALPQRTVT